MENNLSKNDWKKWAGNLLDFLLPLVIIYVGQVTGFLNDSKHIFDIKDMIPTQFTLGAISLYILNALRDLQIKFKEGK